MQNNITLDIPTEPRAVRFPETPTEEQVIEAIEFVRSQVKDVHLQHDKVLAMFPLSDWPYHPILHREIGIWHRSFGCSLEGLVRIFFEEHAKWLKHSPNHNGPIPHHKSRLPKLCPHCGKPLT